VGCDLYFSTNDLEWMCVEVGTRNIFEVVKVLLDFSHVCINWNDFVVCYSGMDNDMCITCWIDICCALKNAFPNFFSHSHQFVLFYIYVIYVVFIFWYINLLLINKKYNK
jgi:hypothetical protein